MQARGKESIVGSCERTKKSNFFSNFYMEIHFTVVGWEKYDFQKGRGEYNV